MFEDTVGDELYYSGVENDWLERIIELQDSLDDEKEAYANLLAIVREHHVEKSMPTCTPIIGYDEGCIDYDMRLWQAAGVVPTE